MFAYNKKKKNFKSLRVERWRRSEWRDAARRVKRAPRRPFQGFKKRFQSYQTSRKALRLDIPFYIRKKQPARYLSTDRSLVRPTS